jgi:phosphate/sulfate permease
LKQTTQFIPTWVKVAVALALGLGTMVGWKRIVVTVGEKIGKAHLTYGQGASAELVAMATIGAADVLGLPVSTTHVLSSGVAGTMAANNSGLQMNTLRNLLRRPLSGAERPRALIDRYGRGRVGCAPPFENPLDPDRVEPQLLH